MDLGLRRRTIGQMRQAGIQFGEIGELQPDAATIMQYSQDPEWLAFGENVFRSNCTSCHGETAQGDRDLGAPDLTDAIWLYGGDRTSLTYTVNNARYGVMPAWGQRLSDEDVRAVSIYVHSLGGGE